MDLKTADTIVTKSMFRFPLDGNADALPPEEYERRFLQAVADSFRAFRSDLVPQPQEVLNNTTVARRFFGTEKMLHSFFAKMFPSYLMNVAAKCPYHEVRQEILRDCWDEEVNDADAEGMCHIEVLHQDVAALGISREDVENFEPTPVLMACTHALDNLSRVLPWEGGYAAIGGLETARLAVARGYLTADEDVVTAKFAGRTIEELCGLAKGSLISGPLHARKDLVHGGGALKILKKYATSRETQELTFWAVKTARSIRVITQREQRRLALAAIGLAADSLVVS